MKSKYKNLLVQLCRQCSTSPNYCNKKKCTRFNLINEMISQLDDSNKVKQPIVEKNINKYKTLIKLEHNGVLQEYLDNKEEIINMIKKDDSE